MKALWAFEPFHQDRGASRGMYNLLKQLTGSSSRVELGYVVTRSETELNLAFDIPIEKRYSVYPRELIHAALKKAGLRVPDSKIQVDQFNTMSTTKAVDRLLGLAKSRGADIIGLFTQSKRGLARLTLGSFAETAIHRSRAHLLVMNPKVKPPAKIKRVLFASDFSPAAKADLRQVLQICKTLRAELEVIHATEVIYRWTLDPTNPEVLAYRRKVDKAQAEVESLVRRAGVKGRVTLNSEFKSITDVVLRTLKRTRADLVVVAAESGPLAALMGGSVTRQIVRLSPKPVLVLKRGRRG